MSYTPPTEDEARAESERLTNQDLANYLRELADEQRDGILAVAASRLEGAR